jgi:[ribosomal protein S5]-alanine N-acetyltransferase
MNQDYYSSQLESSRIICRKLTEDDISVWSEFFADPEAIEFFTEFESKPYLESATIWIGKQLTRYAENRYGLLALIEKKSGNLVGLCGLLTQEVDGKPELEVGYHVLKKYWGNGFAPEAAKLFIDYAFRNNITDSVISIIDTGNLKSQRVAEKNGLVREKQVTWRELEVYIYRIKKSV